MKLLITIVIYQKHVTANKFNYCFANIGSNLANKIKPVKSIVAITIALITILIQYSLLP